MRSHATDTASLADHRTHSSADPWLGSSEDMVRRFIDVLLVERRYSLYTCADYRTDLLGLDRWLHLVEHCTLVTADDRQLIRYLTVWLGRRKSTRKLPRILLSLRRFYAFLCDSHVREDNPMLSANIGCWDEQQRPKTVRIRRQRESSQAIAERDRVMLALVIAGGLQASQLISLRMSDLCLEQGWVSISGNPATRRVRLSSELVDMLRQFVRDPRETLLRGRDSGHVFPACGGRALTGKEFWHAFRRRAEGLRAPTRREPKLSHGRAGAQSSSQLLSLGRA